MFGYVKTPKKAMKKTSPSHGILIFSPMDL
jgi:hypothetical protein